MSKAHTLRRSFSLFRRVPTSTVINTAARHGHESIQIQRVRFKQPFFTRRRLVGTTLAAVGFYAFLTKLDDIIPDIDEEVDQAEDEEDSALLFFPTGLSRPKKREFYRASDPEWQEFVRLSRDRARLKRIREEFIAALRNLIANDPSYKRRLGKINPRAGGSWVEIKFPDGPPIEYERPGYELTDELTLRKTTRPVEPRHHGRLSHILAPTATATSLFMDTKRRAVRSWDGFQTYLGRKADKTEATTQAPTKVGSVPSSSSNPKPSSSDSTTSSTEPASPTENITETKNDSSASPSPPSPPSSASSSSPTTPSANPITKRFDTALPDPTLTPENLPTMNLAYFRNFFRKYNKPPASDLTPPRGSILVHGLVEIIGEKGKATLDFAACYDTSTARYSKLSLKMRSITDYRQRPKGGE